MASIYVHIENLLQCGRQIVWMGSMLNMCSDMPFTRTGKVSNCLTHWKIFLQMWLGGAFIMEDLYKGWGRKQPLFPSTMINRISLMDDEFNLFVFILWSVHVCWCSVRLEQGTVTTLLQEKGANKGVHYRTRTGQEMTAYAPLTVVCDGGFSKLRASLSESKVKIILFPCHRS